MPNHSGWSMVGENRDLETLHHEERCALAVAMKSGCSEDLKQVSTKLTAVPFIRSIIHLEAIFTLKWHLLHNK